MTFKLGDRVRESTTTTGTGALTLGGADVGFSTFASRLSTGDTTWYALVFGASWEVGIGTFTAPSTLARTTVIASTNSDAALNLGAGTKEVFITAPASALVTLSSATTLRAFLGITTAGNDLITAPSVAAQRSILGVPPGYLSSFIMTNNAADATNDLDLGPVSARSDDNVLDLVTSATIVKQIDVAFAEYVAPGTPSGMRDSADNLAVAKWFRVFLIGGAGKNSQPFASTSATPTLPSGFTAKRLIGFIYWTGSAIKAFIQTGRSVRWVTTVTDISTSAASTSGALTGMTAPPARVDLAFNYRTFCSGNPAFLYVRSPDQTNETPSNSVAPLGYGGNSGAVYQGFGKVITNASGQIGVRALNASTEAIIATLGWTYLEL
jgi:hypothetical protein